MKFRIIILTLTIGLLSCNKNLNIKTIEPTSKNIDGSHFSKTLTSELNKNRDKDSKITLKIPKGKYHFYENKAFEKECYISNHDQTNPKKVVFPLENISNIEIDGQGSELIFHGRLIPISIVNCANISLKNFSIDFAMPAMRQIEILEIDKNKDEILAKLTPSGGYFIDEGRLVFYDNNYEVSPYTAMAFNADKRLTYQRRDVDFNPQNISHFGKDTIIIKSWHQIEHTKVGERYALRTYERPTPAIFISESSNLYLENIKVHFAEGMGLLAQMSENIFLNKFSVSLPPKSDRYFTTQADATHFSACKGTILPINGLYEAMADDAINVHGTYLRVLKRIDENKLQARYMHHQAWGFKWGEVGDTVQFVESEKMEIVEKHINTIKSIKAVDKESEFGAKTFEIEFKNPLPEQISEKGKYGIENLTWTPNVIFANNIIRNNRARGALFSTPKLVICKSNTFDHTHGTAILLCGDCNGWYETGACRNVIISNNKFINALTANYQFTNAVISIYPEIPNLEEQKEFFHSGIIIENNIFETFDKPILYAKSTKNLIFRNNKISYNNDFEAFHWNDKTFFFEKVKNIIIENNRFEKTISAETDIKTRLTQQNSVRYQNNTN